MVTRVCVLGETYKQAIELLDELCEANAEDIFRRRRDVAIMNDGTELIAISISVPDQFRGRHFDYVFIKRGMLMYYCVRHGEAIEYLEQRCLVRSEVPREFQLCQVD